MPPSVQSLFQMLFIGGFPPLGGVHIVRDFICAEMCLLSKNDCSRDYITWRFFT